METKPQTMDIVTGCGYPANKLSNFESYSFEVDGVRCQSMEGFLQSLKFEDPEKQKEVCLLVGKKAKFKGKKKKWQEKQVVYWQKKTLSRHGTDYQKLLDKAFEALAENPMFQKVLLDTEKAVICHSEGKSDPCRTILTEEEFCSRLMNVRTRLQNKEKSFL